jgi:pseudaminic acid cytidylyltransferase
LIVIIPARGGSKRILNKNKKIFNGVPIIARVIKNLEAIPKISRIIVSTDENEIATIAKNVGGEVPFIRPDNISYDHTDTISVVKHAIELLRIKENEIIGCVYPTSVFLNQNLVKLTIDSVKSNPDVFSFFAKEFRHPIQRAFRLDQDNRVKFGQIEVNNLQTQDYETFYHDAGQIYGAYSSTWQKENQIIKNDSIAIIDSNFVSVDIDSVEDWKLAELLYNSVNRLGGEV